MSIPFTQYLLPNGRRQRTEVDRPAEIEAIARRFIDAGGRYECEVLTTGQVILTAVMDLEGEPQDVEMEICGNGPKVMDATDRLVRNSIKHIGGFNAV